MRTYKELTESFDNWVKPDKDDLKHEYEIEYVIKPLKNQTGNVWPRFEDFRKSAEKGKVVRVTELMDRKISNRSRTSTKDQLISLIRGYASYPRYRNEDTIEGIYNAFEDGENMTMPIVLKFPDGSMRVMGGNTRMDIAFQLGLRPSVLMVDVPEKERGD